MSQVNTNVNYTLSATDAGASSAFAKLSKEMERSAAKAAMVKDNAGFAGKELDKFAKIGGIALIGKTLADATAKALELRDAFQSGAKSAGEIGLELLKSVPVIGQFAAAGENLRKLFDTRFADAARDLAQANEETKNIEARGKAQDSVGALLKSSRSQADVANLGVGGSDRQKAELAARQQFERNMESVRAEEKKLRDAGIIDGKEFAKLDLIKRNFQDIYDAALLAAQVEDAKARQKVEEDIRKKEEERQKNLQEEAAKRAKQQADYLKLQQEFFEEDQMNALEGRRDEIQNRIGELSNRKASIGLTTQSETDFGASALIAARSQKAADPGLAVLKQSQKTLTEIERQMKGLREDAKLRQRTEQVQSIFN